MSNVATLIADMVRAGVDPELIGRTAAALSHKEPLQVVDEQAERRRERDRERKRLRNSAETAEIQTATLPPKEIPQTPKEITPNQTTPATPKGVSTPKRATRLPSDFLPDLDWAIAAGLSPQQASSEAAKFIDYWAGKGGAGATKLDWPATWRNWVRSAVERMPNARGSPSQARLKPPHISHLFATVPFTEDLHADRPEPADSFGTVLQLSAPPRSGNAGGR